jgi:hypothetical protein
VRRPSELKGAAGAEKPSPYLAPVKWYVGCSSSRCRHQGVAAQYAPGRQTVNPCTVLPFGGRSPRSNAQNEVSLHARACILPVARPRSGLSRRALRTGRLPPTWTPPCAGCCGATGTTGGTVWHGTRAPENQNLGASGAQSSRPAIVGPIKINYNEKCQKHHAGWCQPSMYMFQVVKKTAR